MIRTSWEFLWGRINDRSTILGLSEAIGYAAMLPYPVNMIVFFIRSAVAFVPDGKLVKPAQ